MPNPISVRSITARLLSLSLLAGAAFASPVPISFTNADANQAKGPATPALTGIAHIALRVRDLNQSVAFYQSMGFEKAFDRSRDGQAYEVFIKINDRQFIELYSTSATNQAIGFLHVCFESDDLQSLRDSYVVRGLAPTPLSKAGAGNLLFTMKGPETGTGPQNMEYTQYQAGSLHTNDLGLHLGPHRVADGIVSVAIAIENVPAAESFYETKAQFVHLKGDEWAIPGQSVQRIRLVDARDQKSAATFALHATSQKSAKKTLKAAAISAKHSRAGLTITDPDGNRITLAP